MDSTDNKGGVAAVDIMAAVLSNMNKDLPVINSGGPPVLAKDQKRVLEMDDNHHLHDADVSDNGDNGSEKKDESTEKQRGKCGGESSNTSNETADGGSSCRDDSDGDFFVSASNKLMEYRYSVEELVEISAAEVAKSNPEFIASELLKFPMILRSTQSNINGGGGGGSAGGGGAADRSGGSTENMSLGRNNTPVDSNGPLLTRLGNAGANTGRGGAPFAANRNGRGAAGFRGGEQEIILSPQIRSFNMGCQLPPASISFPGVGSGSSSGAGGVPGAGGLLDPGNNEGNTASAGRRIGSGRLMSREERMGEGGGGGGGGRGGSGAGGGWNSDYKSGEGRGGGGSNSGGGGSGYGNENYGDMDGDYHRGGGGRTGGGGGMNKQNTRFFRSNMNDRRGDGNEMGGGGGGHRGGYNNNYRNNSSYGDNGERVYHRNNHRYEQEEPEWFTGGPSSQLDTIELHGFDGHHQSAEEGKGDESSAAGAGGGRKFKRINEVEKEMKANQREDTSGEQSNNDQRKNKPAAAEATTGKGEVGGGGGAKGTRRNSGSENEQRKARDAFPAFGGGGGGLGDEEEESALRKMVPSGSSPIKKPGGAGGQMDMRHFEDFLRLEDLLSSDDFEEAGHFVGGGDNGDENNNSKRRSQMGTSRFQQWFKSDDPPQGPGQPAAADGKLSESVMNFMQTAKGGQQQQQSNSNNSNNTPTAMSAEMQSDPNPVPRPPSSTSGTSEILSVKDLEASMQKKASQVGPGGVPNQAQHFAQGPKIFGTGRLMNRIPNLMDQQVALQNQQKMHHHDQQQQQMNHHQQQQQQQPLPHPIQQMQGGGGVGGPPQQQPSNNSGVGPDDMMAFQSFLAQMSKSSGGGGVGPGPMGHQQPGGNQQGPPQMAKGGRMWEEANMLANSGGTPPILKMIMQQQQQQQQFLQENLNRQQQALALVKAQAALRLSPNVFANHTQQVQSGQPPQLTSPNNGPVGGGPPQLHLPHSQMGHPQQQQQQPPPPPPGVPGLLPVVSPPKRIPSPRELQQHTQTIMQTALIRKKLQEQSENFRRRQEQLFKEQQQHPQMPSNNKHGDGQPKMSSPTPAALAFTPTSVLRKMTAQGTVHGGTNGGQQAGGTGGASSSPPPGHGMVDIKIPTPQQGTVGGIVINNGEDLLRLKQSSMTSSGPKCWSPPLPQMVGGGTSQLQQVMGNSNNIPSKPMGRPIVKGGGMEGGAGVSGGIPGGPGAVLNEYHMQQLHQQMLMQQQQRQAMENQKMQQLFQQIQQQQQQQQQQRNSLLMGAGPNGPNPGVVGGGAPMRGGGMPFPGHQPQQQQPSNQGQPGAPLRAIVGSGGGGTSGGGGGNGGNNLANMMFASQLQQQPQGGPSAGLNFMARDGGMSPTSNQLARWFSPELLAKAQAGKLPSLNQSQAMSLEEFERNMSNGPTTGAGGGGLSTQPPIGIKRN